MNASRMTVRDVAELVGGRVDGDGDMSIEGFGPIEQAGERELTFAADEAHAARLADSKAGAAIVAEHPRSADIPLIRVDNVMAAVTKLLTQLQPPRDLPPIGVDPTAVVDPGAEIAESAAVGPHCTVHGRAKIGPGTHLCDGVSIGSESTVGENCLLAAGCVVEAGCSIGNRVRIGPNSVIGYDGFGYYTHDGVHHLVPHVGTVVIEDDVELGACTCVDRAKFGETRIAAGTKIDNLCQIAHNVKLGRGCLLAAQIGLAGSVTFEDYVAAGGQSGVADHCRLGTGTRLGAQAGAIRSFGPGESLWGTPAMNARKVFRAISLTRKLPELHRRIAELEKKIESLGATDDNS